MEVHILVIPNLFLCFQWNSCPNRQTSSLNRTSYCVGAICDLNVVLWVLCCVMYRNYDVSPSGRWRLPIPVTWFCRGSPSGQCYLCLFCSPRGQCRTDSPSGRCLVAGRRRLGMILRRRLLQRHFDGLLHLCHTAVLLFDDCRRRCIIPALMASTKLCCSWGPTGATASGTSPMGGGLDDDGVPASSSPTTKSFRVRGDARARAPRLARDIGTDGVLFGVLLSFGWGLVFFRLGTFGMFWNKYTCYNLVDKNLM